MADQIQPKAAEVLERLSAAFHIADYPDWREFAAEQGVDRWNDKEMAETKEVWEAAGHATGDFHSLVMRLVGKHVDSVAYCKQFAEFLDDAGF
jgi:hypothetical protein